MLLGIVYGSGQAGAPLPGLEAILAFPGERDALLPPRLLEGLSCNTWYEEERFIPF